MGEQPTWKLTLNYMWTPPTHYYLKSSGRAAYVETRTKLEKVTILDPSIFIYLSYLHFFFLCFPLLAMITPFWPARLSPSSQHPWVVLLLAPWCSGTFGESALQSIYIVSHTGFTCLWQTFLTLVILPVEWEGNITHECTSHPSNIKTWLLYRFVADSSRLIWTRLIWNL